MPGSTEELRPCPPPFHEQSREEQIAWAGGFLDGEGHFGLNRVNTWLYPTPVIQATQSNARIAPLYRLKDLFGGGVYQQNRSGAKGGRDYGWRLSGGKKCREVLPELLPYLCVKGIEAGLVLDYALLVPEPGRIRVSPEQRARQLDIKELIQRARRI